MLFDSRAALKVRSYTQAAAIATLALNIAVTAEAQRRRNIHLKLNTAFGVTSKAPDFAPEIGVMIKF